MNCRFIEDDHDSHVKRCTRCKRELRSPHPPEKCHAKCKRRGLGDYIAGGLQLLGVKKKRKCGCDGRQAALNEAGAKVGL
jgi:hypothetical protein